MLAKLALRNVKRQFGSYLIYFLTVAITVALMFAVNNTIFSRELLERASSIKELMSGLVGITVIVSLIVAFILGYATSFMLRLRKKEFGTYLTLGMTRRNILSVFFIETLIMFAVALAIGIVLGLFLFQGLMALVSNLMEMPSGFAAYSWQGLALTAGTVSGIFLLSSAASARYLKRVKIYDLIHADKKVDKTIRNPKLWLWIAGVSAALLLAVILLFGWEMERMSSGAGSGMLIMLYLFLVAVFVFTFHAGAARGGVAMLLRNKKFCGTGTRTFALRQLSGKLKSNSVMMGCLAVLIALSIVGSNVSFVQKATSEQTLDRNYPFDVDVNLYVGGQSDLTFEEGERIIRRYSEIERKVSYQIREGEDNYLHSYTPYSGENYKSLKDSFLSESDYNRLMDLKGWEKLKLNGGFAILSNITNIRGDFSSARLKLGGREYSYRQTIDGPMRFSYNAYFLAIVPDEAMVDLTLGADCIVYDLKEEKFDAAALRKELSYLRDSGAYQYEWSDYRIREYGRIEMNGNVSVFVLGAIYISIVFVLMAMALLALKTLSDLGEDRRKYAVLFRLGADRQLRNKTLFAQIFCFFVVPFILPLLLSVPTAILCSQLMGLSGFASQGGVSAGIAGGVVLVTAAIYFLYFAATYSIAKKNILSSTPPETELK